MGDRLAKREQAALQPLDEDRKTGDYARQPDEDFGQIGERLPQHHDLKEGHDGNDRRQIPRCAHHAPTERNSHFYHQVPPVLHSESQEP